MEETSLFAYITIENSLSRRQDDVIQALEILGPSTNHEIATYLGLDPNSITGRINELCEQGRVEFTGKRPCNDTGYLAKTHGIVGTIKTFTF